MKVSDDMVEGVARALWERATSDPWGSASEKFRKHYLNDARAALAALLDAFPRVDVRTASSGSFIPFTPVNAAWRNKRVALVPLDD